MDAASRSHFERRVRKLAGYGHRGSATDGEKQAAVYLAEELVALGLEPVTEPFTGSRSLGGRLLLHVGVAAAGAALLWHLPGLTVFLGLVALGSLIMESTSRGRLLSRLIMWNRSCNVVARLAPHGGEAKLRLIICGHYDSQRTGIIWSETLWKHLMPMLRKLPAFLQSAFVPVSLAMFIQPFVGMADIAGFDRASVSVAGASLLIIYAVTGVLLADWSVGAHVPGARCQPPYEASASQNRASL